MAPPFVLIYFCKTWTWLDHKPLVQSLYVFRILRTYEATELEIPVPPFRYYINRVKDVYRQATIDMMLGHDLQSDELSTLALSGTVRTETPEDSEVEKEQNLRTLIEESRRMLLAESEECLGAWGLIDCDPATGDPTQQDTDIILLLSKHAYYIAK